METNEEQNKKVLDFCHAYYDNLNKERPGKLKEFSFYWEAHKDSMAAWRNALAKDILQ